MTAEDGERGQQWRARKDCSTGCNKKCSVADSGQTSTSGVTIILVVNMVLCRKSFARRRRIVSCIELPPDWPAATLLLTYLLIDCV